MCGRYAQTRAADQIARDFHVQQVLVGAGGGPSWNVAPTNVMPVVLERVEDDAPVRQLRALRWGLVPSWAKDESIGSRMINARAETITDKPSFRRAAAARRAAIPMDGYFEWMKEPGSKTKTPFYLTGPDDSPLVAAGLYELWPDPAKSEDDPDRWLWTYTVITTTATDSLGHIHDRAPLLLPDELVDTWLDPSLRDAQTVRDLVLSVPEPQLVPREVGRGVGNVRNNGPELITPA